MKLNPGESREVSVTIDPKYLSIFDETVDGWKLLPGEYSFMAGGSSQALPLKEKATLK